MSRRVLIVIAGLLLPATACGAAGSAARVSAPAVAAGTRPAASTTTLSPAAPSRQFKTVQSGFAVDRPSDPDQPTMDVFAIAPVGRGPFPLIVFSHGFRSVAQSYTAALEGFARQGYVVVGPNYPYEDSHSHPADISLVIDKLSGPKSPFARGFVDLHHIAVAGHSLGGVDVYGVTYNSCCRDHRITAAFTFEGASGGFPEDQYSWRGRPLLIVIGDADPLIAPDTGKKIFRQFRTAAYLLTVKGGGHGGGLSEDNVGYTSVQATVRDFLASYLYDDARALHSLRTKRSRPDTSLRVKP